MQGRRRRRQSLGALGITLSLLPLGSAMVAQAQTQSQEPSKSKKSKVVGCDIKAKPSETSGITEVCVATDVEAWYHITPGSGLPPDVPLHELPEESPYPEDTLHVGQQLGEENSRTYLTLDLSAVPIGATISDALMYLPLNEAGGTQEPRAASFRACLVTEPPENNKDGSFEQPPEVDCSKDLSSPSAAFEEKPRPHFVLDFGPLSEIVTTTTGIALTPTKVETQRAKTWHLAFYTRKNKDKAAEPITTRITYIESITPTFGTDPPPPPDTGSSSTSFGSSGGFTAPSSGAAALPETIDGVEEPTDPVDAGEQPIIAAEPTALTLDPDAYSIKWLVPLLLLLGAVFWSFVLNRDIRLPPR